MQINIKIPIFTKPSSSSHSSPQCQTWSKVSCSALHSGSWTTVIFSILFFFPSFFVVLLKCSDRSWGSFALQSVWPLTPPSHHGPCMPYGGAILSRWAGAVPGPVQHLGNAPHHFWFRNFPVTSNAPQWFLLLVLRSSHSRPEDASLILGRIFKLNVNKNETLSL